MMAWIRLPVEVRCGGCGALLAAGQPVLALRIGAMTRRLYRGECCAGPAPAEPQEREPGVEG